MNFTELFTNCARRVKYQEIGDNVDYAFVEDGRTLYIYFKGSDSDVDWRYNFSFWKKPYKDMDKPYRVHGGFMTCWKQVEDIVIEKITEKDAAGAFQWDKIITVGYSHGGALAAFCHECVWFHREDIRDDCWGFGFEAPRIYAGFLFRKKLRSRWKNFRVFRNRQDIVTHVPPRLFGFWHVGKVVKIGGRWKPFAALKGWIAALFKKDKDAAKQHRNELIQTAPHYANDVIASLEVYDRTADGRGLLMKVYEDDRSVD